MSCCHHDDAVTAFESAFADAAVSQLAVFDTARRSLRDAGIDERLLNNAPIAVDHAMLAEAFQQAVQYW